MRLLVALSTASVVVIAVALVVAVGTASSDPTHAASASADIRALPVGGVQPVVVALPGAGAGTARVFVVRETGDSVVAFLGRSTASTECPLAWVHDHDRAALTTSPRVAFEDPCGAAFYALDGACLAGPCHRGLDHYASRVVGGRVTIDLADLVPGEPRA
jgi:hypothetical protein